ncbi:protein TolQ [Palleronia sediminis]|uniref:Tol-Pal system protein TolQ n=1 Tax=Palleronia sediminis TaxID=2547833 RepID=A0A4V6PP33_9RHOB|nr:protein TolQ [Palleronia sediminis]TDL76339.1 protein TolQ [Palleronia sediminis]
MEPETLAAASEIDFSMLALFARATITVKLVMLILIAASIWGWAITIRKYLAFRAARSEQARFEAAFWSGEPLDELYRTLGPEPDGRAASVFAAGMGEWQRSHADDGRMIPGAQSRIERSMDVAISREADDLERSLPILATIGSTAPFIGLFGTVWGIMNAFVEIAEQQNTSLAVVAPGIAEALLATGLGLLAAIPAVVFYNKLSTDAARIVGGYEAFSDEFSTILSRQIDG